MSGPTTGAGAAAIAADTELDAEQGPATIWNRQFLLVCAVAFIANIAQFMMVALIPLLAAELGATAVLVGVVSGAFAVTALASRFFVGATTARFPKRPLLVLAFVLIAASFVLYAVAPNVTVVLVGRLLHGVGMGFLAPVTLAMVADAVPKQRIASGVGIFSLGQAAAMAIGPALGLALLGATSYVTTFLVCAGALAVSAAVTLWIPKERSFVPGPFRISRDSIIAREALVPAIVMFFLASGFAAINAFVVLYGQALGIASVGLFFTVYAVTMLSARPFTGRLADRFGAKRVVLPSMVSFLVAFVLLAVSHDLVLLLVAAVLAGLGYGVCQPLVQGMSLAAVEPSRRAVAGSTNYFGVDLAYLLTPIAAGAVVSGGTAAFGVAGGYALMFATMTVPVVLAILVMWRARRSTRG